MASTLDLVMGVIVDHVNVDPETMKPSTDFEKALRCDSLDMIEIAMAVEEVFDIEIADDEILKIVTIQDAADLVDRTLNKETKAHG